MGTWHTFTSQIMFNNFDSGKEKIKKLEEELKKNEIDYKKIEFSNKTYFVGHIYNYEGELHLLNTDVKIVYTSCEGHYGKINFEKDE